MGEGWAAGLHHESAVFPGVSIGNTAHSVAGRQKARLLQTTTAVLAAGMLVNANQKPQEPIKNDVDRAFIQYAFAGRAKADPVPDPRAYLADKYGEPDEDSAHLVTWFSLRESAELSLWREADDASWSAYRIVYRDGREFWSSKGSDAIESTSARIKKECQSRDIASFHRILEHIRNENGVVQLQRLEDVAHWSSVHLWFRDAPLLLVLDTIAPFSGRQVSPPDGVGTRLSFDSGDEGISTNVALAATITFLRERGIMVYTNEHGKLSAAWE